MFASVRLIIFSVKQQSVLRNISVSAVQKMPFAKHEIVPDVIPVKPAKIAQINYVGSGGDYSIFQIKTNLTAYSRSLRMLSYLIL